MPVPIADPVIGEGEQSRVKEVLESGELADGEIVRSFESAFADHSGTSYGVATSNGTTALHTALEALDISRGSRVLTTPFSFVASANAIRLAGGQPMFADIDPRTFNLDPEAVEDRLSESGDSIDAMVVVHLYGLPAEMDRLLEIAEAHDIAVIEDAAQAHGARYREQPVGSLGDVGCFSFYPTKNMTTGEGGMLTTDRADVAEAAGRFIDHGRTDGRYEHVSLGHNFRMTNIAAAIGLEQLERLPEFVDTRRANAARLTEALADSPVTPPIEPDERRHAYHQYTIRTTERDELHRRLQSEGIGSAVYYPTCIHQLRAYHGFSASLPEAEQAADQVLSLPIHPRVSAQDIDEIAAVIVETTEEAVVQ